MSSWDKPTLWRSVLTSSSLRAWASRCWGNSRWTAQDVVPWI
ncbi:hypothetical protein ADILRU_0448 [Leifsonia rubra CMS 76R]|nr:hypothetical protein ADILRU_0448 [Leifsonia rubra CMS 76R]